MKKLQDFKGKITMGGKEISFHEFLVELSGMDYIYGDEIGEMLDAALDPEVGWHEVDDLISPIAYQLVGEAVQEDREIYFELVGVLRKAWNRLKVKADLEYNADQEIIINENVPDVLHVVEGLIHSLRDGWNIKEATFNAAADMRLVISKE